MTLEEKIYQMFMVTPEMLTGYGVVTEAGDSTKAALAQYPVGGLIYFAQNLETQEQTRTMLANCQAFAEESGIGLFLAVDEEGGTVARVADVSRPWRKMNAWIGESVAPVSRRRIARIRVTNAAPGAASAKLTPW